MTWHTVSRLLFEDVFGDVAQSQLALDTFFPALSACHVAAHCVLANAVRGDTCVASQPLAVGKEVREVGGIDGVLEGLERATFVGKESIDVVHDCAGMCIKHGWLIGAEKELAFCCGAENFPLGKRLLKSAELLWIFEARQVAAPNRALSRIKLRHGNSHLCSCNRVRGNQVDSALRSRLVGKRHDHAAFDDQVTGRSFENRNHAAIQVKVPLSLVVQINHALLELDSLESKRVPGTGDKRTQVVTKHGGINCLSRVCYCRLHQHGSFLSCSVLSCLPSS